jgi:hypothetical protein
MKLEKQLCIKLAVECGLFCLLVASIVLFWKDNIILLVVVVIAGLFALYFWHERYDVSFFLILAMFGTLTEVYSLAPAFGTMPIHLCWESLCGSLLLLAQPVC